MPEMPAFLANVLEPRFARRAKVTEIVALAPRLRKVRLEGEALRGVAFRPGQEVEFRVSERAFRHYTPARFDPERGTLDIVFFLHGEGPGTTWVRQLRQGQQANVLGPGGRFGLLEGATTHVLLGDETTLGLFACLSASAPGRCIGALELADGAQGSPAWPSLVGLELPAVERIGGRGDALVRWIEANDILRSHDVCFYLAGHTGSIVRIREHLLRRGWPKRSIRTKAYWADGKRGL
jgi:NADPH-dependent ferric siderophore reductase